jgi:hypothetical protein
MRALLVVTSLLAASHALAGDNRWTLGFGQGTFEAIVENGSKSSVNIYCPSGQTDTTPGMFIDAGRVKPKAKEHVDVRIIVGGKSYPFTLEENQFQASGRANRNSLYSLVDALARSKAKTFKVEFPKFGVAETFPLLGARKVFKSAKDFLGDCE